MTNENLRVSGLVPVGNGSGGRGLVRGLVTAGRKTGNPGLSSRQECNQPKRKNNETK